MNTKALFALGGGFAPKSIRKICTLHRYELEKLALSKLSRCFSPIQQTKEKMLNWRSRLFCYGVFCHWSPSDFLTRQTFSLDVPVKDCRKLWSESGIQGLAGQCSLMKNHIMHVQPFSTHTHTHHAPDSTISCYALPLCCLLFANRAALAGLTNANQISPHAGLHGVATQVRNPNIKRP